jgi:hypothetical protein
LAIRAGVATDQEQETAKSTDHTPPSGSDGGDPGANAPSWSPEDGGRRLARQATGPLREDRGDDVPGDCSLDGRAVQTCHRRRHKILRAPPLGCRSAR